MFLIAGLGNPKREYDNTRHNIGFDVIDAVADKYSIAVREKGFKALFGKGMIEGQRVILVKPQTYMNLSGESVREITDYFKIDPEEELIVISDDISLGVGGIRIRKRGSAGGHNGLKSVIAHLGTEEFPRIRIGVGEPGPVRDVDEVIDWVIGSVPQTDMEQIRQAARRAAEAAVCYIRDGADTAMNRYNG